MYAWVWQTKDVDNAFIDDMEELQQVGHEQSECQQRDLIVGLFVQELPPGRSAKRLLTGVNIWLTLHFSNALICA
jgi:hypothetical protein